MLTVKVFVPAEFDIYEIYKTIGRQLLKLMPLNFFYLCHTGIVVLDRTLCCLSEAAFVAHNNMEEGASCHWVTKHLHIWWVWIWLWALQRELARSSFKFGPELLCSSSSLPRSTSKFQCGLNRWHVTRIWDVSSCPTLPQQKAVMKGQHY